MLKKNSKYLKTLLPLIIVSLSGCDKDFLKDIINTGVVANKENGEKTVSANRKVSSVMINPSNIILQRNEEKVLTALVYLADGQVDSTNKNIEWESEDRGIVEIDTKGKLRGVRGGETAILAKEKDSGVSNRIVVKVIQTSLVSRIDITPSQLKINPGDSSSLIATVILNDNTKNGNVEWSSSDNTIATVNESGRVTAKKPGTVSIVATYMLDNSYKGTADIIVTNETLNQVPNVITSPVPGSVATPQPSNPSPSATVSPVTSPTPVPAQTSSPSSGVYVPANLTLSKTFIKEFIGNRDNIPNRGESFYLQPTFKNTGGVSTNDLTVKLTSSSDIVAIDTSGYVSVSAIAAGGTSTRSNNTSTYGYALSLKINKTATPGDSIPLTYTIKDEFGNEWKINDSIGIVEIANNLSLGNNYIVESNGNGDNIPNRGETIYLQPTFSNSGFSATNPLTAKLTSTSDLVSIDTSSYISVSSIDAGGTSTRSNNTSTYGYAFYLIISKDAVPGTTIPVTYTLKDEFGNQWTVNSNILIQ